jgi:hypothetical protein
LEAFQETGNIVVPANDLLPGASRFACPLFEKLDNWEMASFD